MFRVQSTVLRTTIRRAPHVRGCGGARTFSSYDESWRVREERLQEALATKVRRSRNFRRVEDQRFQTDLWSLECSEEHLWQRSEAFNAAERSAADARLKEMFAKERATHLEA